MEQQTRTLHKVMTPAEIAAVIDSIKPGDTVEIQFKESDVYDVTYLMGMDSNGFLTVCEDDYTIMLAVAGSQNWGETPLNRIFQFKANNSWDLTWFKGRLAKRLESAVIAKN